MFTATENAHGQPHGNAQTPSEVAAEFRTILAAAHAAAQKTGLRYAGIVSPQDAWFLFLRRAALLIDVRTVEERKFVGHVPHSLHAAWMTGINMVANPHFLPELEAMASKDDVILFLCRSGKRSAAAAEAATKAGFQHVFNVAEGFEGEMEAGQRGVYGGWRSYGLPWVQG